MKANVLNKPREDAIEIWTAGLDAVRAAPLVAREVQVLDDELVIGECHWSKQDFDRVVVIGAGKAGSAMAEGLMKSIGGWLPVVGWINVPEGTQRNIQGICTHAARPAGVNEPTQEGVEGTLKIVDLIATAGPRDLCIALISGGGSALLPAPANGITLEDKLEVTRFLSGAGADITELNTVRKHLSKVKGGGLLRACKAGFLVTLVLSDVLGDPLDAIASGPTVLDTTKASDALDVLKKFDQENQLPDRIYATLRGNDEVVGENKVCSSKTFVIGNNAVAVDEAGIRAEQLGYNHAMQSARQSEGLAEDVGIHLAKMTIQMLRADPEDHRMDCLITGGEPIVQLAPPETRGRGGRNQQLVLAAYQHLLSAGLTDAEWERVCILSGGTDGEDGPTDAAGAFVDGEIHQRAQALGIDLEESLGRNDAYRYFEQVEGLLMTGATGTNVCDVRVAVVRGE